MPRGDLLAALKWMPRLQAEEQLVGVSVTAAGNVTLKEASRDKLLRRLQRIARGGRRERAHRPATKEAWLAGLAARGITVDIQGPKTKALEAGAGSVPSDGQNTAQAGAHAGGEGAGAGGPEG